MSVKDASKAARYVAQLYEARCNGQWNSVPELARKSEKHARERQCLALAARAGALMNQDALQGGYKQADRDYREKLTAALEHEDKQRGDGLDAAVHLAAISLGHGQDGLALGLIPEPLHAAAPPAGGYGEEAWASVCVVMGTLVRGLALEARGELAAATSTYRSILSYIATLASVSSQCPELRRWTEELLCHICLYFFAETASKPTQLGEAMAAFHLLSKVLERSPRRSLSGRGRFTSHTPRRVWRVYYEALSRVVLEDLVYHPSPLDRDHESLEHRGLLEDEDFFASRVQQRANLRHVEANYEQLLLNETKFPKANEVNEEVKSWIDLVMSNWRIFCSPIWTDGELGDGGKNAVSRNTLDILYRASTKTFHSTQILRHLFTVHSFLGEFDLALSAFDTYVEIMTKGKERAEKSGEPGIDLDDNETALRLAAEAIRTASRFGSEATSERSLQTKSTIESWLGQSTANGLEERGEPPHREIESLAYRAIGISQANWARETHDPSARVEFRNKAIGNLRKALDLGVDDSHNTEALYALGLALAEKRDIPGAIDAVKRALRDPKEPRLLICPDGVVAGSARIPSQQQDDSLSTVRKLLPIWHLLSLLLSAREDFETALNVCDAAFEQYRKSSQLGGALKDSGHAPGPDLNYLSARPSVEKPITGEAKSAIESMDSLEKQTLLEMKMTQLSLYEILEDTEFAVNACDELLSLYARIFGPLDIGEAFVSKAKPMISRPKSSRGTIRSIFGRPKSIRPLASTDRSPQFATAHAESVQTSRPGTTTTVAPTIQVTNEEGVESPSEKRSYFRRSARPSREDLRGKSGSLRRRALDTAQATQEPQFSAASTAYTSGRPSTEAGPPRSSHTQDRFQVNGQSEKTVNGTRPLSGAQPLDDVPHNISDGLQPSPAGHTGQPPKQDVRLPAPNSGASSSNSVPNLPTLQQLRLRTSVLVKMWLFIAGLYNRASMHEDSKQAIAEAEKLVSGLELEVSRSESSVKSFQAQGWGRGKCVEELWADVYAERGILYLSQSLPHDALWNFEQALSYYPNHVQATRNLCTILLDIYCQKIPSEKPTHSSLELLAASLSQESSSSVPAVTIAQEAVPATARSAAQTDTSPLQLYRLAARDRAYVLLTSLTKLGSGYDDSEVWSVLARAYEESGQIDKAKEALWWTIELEDTRPVRHWRHVNPGAYVL